jgi:AcrR family transcriptional regulator
MSAEVSCAKSLQRNQPMARQQTTERICKMSIAMFNEHGHSSVSTNHIASAISISTGNLYYYYKNRQAIIRAIYEIMEKEAEIMLELPRKLGHSFELVQFYIASLGNLLSRYRFFFRELSEILRNDPDLRESYGKMEQRFKMSLFDMIHGLTDSGFFRTFDSAEEVEALADTIWILSTSSLSMAEVGVDRLTHEQALKKLTRQLLFLLKPYVTKKELNRSDSIFTHSISTSELLTKGSAL